MPQDRSQHWFVSASELDTPGGARLRRTDSAIQETDQLIPEGGAFTLSLESFYIHEGHDTDGSGNDLLIRSRVRYGDEPRTEVINFFGADIPAGTVKDNLEYEHIFARQDYSEKARIWLEIEVMEIDKGLARDDSILGGLGQVYRDFGGLFATLIPFSGVAASLIGRLETLNRVRDQDKRIFLSTLDLYSKVASAGEAPLRCGAYVFFKDEVEAVQYKLRGLRLERAAPNQQDVPILDDYLVVKVVPSIVKSVSSSDNLLQNQQVATILSHLDDGEKADASRRKQHLSYLQDIVQGSRHLKDLDYFYTLKRQKDLGKTLSQPQEERFFEIADKLSRYIPNL